MEPTLAFDFWGMQLPVPVALAAVALFGYLIGNFRRRAVIRQEPLQARRELKRAQAVIKQLEKVSKEIRTSLATHQSSILHFKDRVSLLSAQQKDATWNELCQEAERMLRPTMQLANQIANAYDEIRQQTNMLMSFSEVRTDPLTGLSNRRALDETMKHLFALNHRYGNRFSIVIFDIDHFKQVNDESGHLEGDRLLQAFADLLDSCVRASDIAARYGGEEFVVVLAETDLTGACIFAERMRQRIAQQLPLTVSAGVAEAANKEDMQGILSRSDSALYSAKASGRDRVYVHTGDDIEPVGKVVDLGKCAINAQERWPELAPCEADDYEQPAEEEQLEILAIEVSEVSESARLAVAETTQVEVCEEDSLESDSETTNQEPASASPGESPHLSPAAE